MQTDNESPASGQMLGGRYEVRGVLGRGGMAEVRDGWDTRLNRPVAIKMMHPARSAVPEHRERFRAEACAAAGLNHPNVVAVYDFGDDHGMPFIVMERLPGTTLADEIALGPLSEERVRSVLTHVLTALGAAHAVGILHRDIKPGNILVADADVTKLADFGIATTPDAADEHSGRIEGSLAYVSPERLAGAAASTADDIYAVGVVGYECLSGHQPREHGDDLVRLARAILHDQPSPLTKLCPNADPHLIQVIERAMTRDPQRRFPSVEAMRAELNDSQPVRAAVPPTRVKSCLPAPTMQCPDLAAIA